MIACLWGKCIFISLIKFDETFFFGLIYRQKQEIILIYFCRVAVLEYFRFAHTINEEIGEERRAVAMVIDKIIMLLLAFATVVIALKLLIT